MRSAYPDNRLEEWLSKHPLREPAGLAPASYTVQVMTRISSTGRARSGPVFQRWLPRPQLSFALSTVLIGLITFSFLNHQASVRIERLNAELNLLQEMGVFAEINGFSLLDEIRDVDQFMLAQAVEAELLVQEIQELLNDLPLEEDDLSVTAA
ncbi:MAG: hypothetical protein NC819_00395 [Candidatus Omnitrophica bacterium]|nr:hypothetical protein [Candidatus Omnitrophota bacterium]